MASKQRKLKRFTGTRSNPPAPRSAEKSGAAVVANRPSRKVSFKAGQTIAPTSPPSVKTAPATNKPSPIKPARPAPLSRHAWAPPRLPFTPDIPSLYHETYVRMIPRGPHHVFSFWEMGPDALEKVKGHGVDGPDEAAAQPVLRLYTVGPDKGKRPQRIGDIALSAGTHSHYVRVPESGRMYRLDLGVMTTSGRFVPVCRSNEAATPRARVMKAAGRGSRRADTRKLIDFSMLSGKIIAEADLDSGVLFFDSDEPLAVEPDSDVSRHTCGASSLSGVPLPPDNSAR